MASSNISVPIIPDVPIRYSTVGVYLIGQVGSSRRRACSRDTSRPGPRRSAVVPPRARGERARSARRTSKSRMSPRPFSSGGREKGEEVRSVTQGQPGVVGRNQPAAATSCGAKIRARAATRHSGPTGYGRGLAARLPSRRGIAPAPPAGVASGHRGLGLREPISEE